MCKSGILVGLRKLLTLGVRDLLAHRPRVRHPVHLLLKVLVHFSELVASLLYFLFSLLPAQDLLLLLTSSRRRIERNRSFVQGVRSIDGSSVRFGESLALLIRHLLASRLGLLNVPFLVLEILVNLGKIVLSLLHSLHCIFWADRYLRRSCANNGGLLCGLCRTESCSGLVQLHVSPGSLFVGLCQSIQLLGCDHVTACLCLVYTRPLLFKVLVHAGK
mmetsp:Transcript_18540/g.49766  ORF Transcript_18540/g.49766 Transcript_18540/m.49766 type:complete len:218 (+) Transcript_18540:540-1193(+)